MFSDNNYLLKWHDTSRLSVNCFGSLQLQLMRIVRSAMLMFSIFGLKVLLNINEMKQATQGAINNFTYIHTYIYTFFGIFIRNTNPPRLKCGTCGIPQKSNFKLKNLKFVRKEKQNQIKIIINTITNSLKTRLVNKRYVTNPVGNLFLKKNVSLKRIS